MTAAIDDLVSHEQAIVNGVRLHYVEAGPEDGDLVVFLHGFPECWYTWRRQLVALAEAGYRVVAPDLRGYNRSEKPRGLEAYRLETLTADVDALVREVALEDEADGTGTDTNTNTDTNASAHLVSHDWGGILGWATATRDGETVDRLVVINAPHPIKYSRELTLEQAVRSWYALFFQVPWLPERLFAAGDYRAIDDLFRDGPARPGAFTDEDVARFKRAAAQPGALESAINYYRAFARGPVRANLAGSIPFVGDRFVGQIETVDVPTLVLWGERDEALSTDQLEGLERYATDLQVERFPNASHWVHADEADAVTDALLEFLGE